MAIPLPAPVAVSLAAIVPDLRALRRVAPPLLHITLAFVGALPEDRVPEATEAASSAAVRQHPFSVEIDTVGRFPAGGPPRVVWAASSDRAAGAAVVELGAAVRAELGRRSVPFDAKPLLPHITLARVREGATAADTGAIRDAVSAARVPAGLVIEVAEIHVMESVLTRAGPRYSSRAVAPLRG